ncbi:MAG TPA: dihydroneopterin aldolase [Acidimicrobiales bacterium]|nr:dihydroneopterin aldolase [Acidimicrobiales bacterium]
MDPSHSDRPPPGRPHADRIELRGLRSLGVHGVLPEERDRPQPFEVDLDLELDLSRAGRSDDLADTADYGAVAQAVAEVIGGEHADLLEHLAERIAASVFAAAPLVDAVTVRLRKLRPPVPVPLGTAGVTIHRTRAGRGPRD